jgi:hypothetical protein
MKTTPKPKPSWLDAYTKTCAPCDGTGVTCKNCGKGESKCRCKVKRFVTCTSCRGSGVANLDELERLVREREGTGWPRPLNIGNDHG